MIAYTLHVSMIKIRYLPRATDNVSEPYYHFSNIVLMMYG